MVGFGEGEIFGFLGPHISGLLAQGIVREAIQQVLAEPRGAPESVVMKRIIGRLDRRSAFHSDIKGLREHLLEMP